MPVPADGNCTATMGHLDPTNRGEYYPCDNTQPQSCQAGYVPSILYLRTNVSGQIGSASLLFFEVRLLLTRQYFVETWLASTET